MDAQKFGAFLAELRKEKGWTQRQLAERLHVTDKAVSRWERGLGFPDIKTIEPLADTLEVSVLELMQSERIADAQVPAKNAQEAIAFLLVMAAYRRSVERLNTLIAVSFGIILIMTCFLVDTMEPIGFFMICLPILFLVIGILLLAISWIRHRHGHRFTWTLLFGVLALLAPILFCLLIAFAFALGGPVPN